MKILGIDYGRKKIGLAIAEGSLAEPYRVLRVDNYLDAIKKVEQVTKGLQIDLLVVGISEGEMGEESKRFAEEIGAETFDETLSTQDAQRLSMEAGVPRKSAVKWRMLMPLPLCFRTIWTVFQRLNF